MIDHKKKGLFPIIFLLSILFFACGQDDESSLTGEQILTSHDWELVTFQDLKKQSVEDIQLTQIDFLITFHEDRRYFKVLSGGVLLDRGEWFLNSADNTIILGSDTATIISLSPVEFIYEADSVVFTRKSIKKIEKK